MIKGSEKLSMITFFRLWSLDHPCLKWNSFTHQSGPVSIFFPFDKYVRINKSLTCSELSEKETMLHEYLH